MLRIILKYNTYDIEAVAVFTGAPPPVSELVYEHQGFRTSKRYEFASIIAAHQDEAVLIASKNAFALALLAAKYAYEARGDQGRLFALKRKVLELCLKSGVDKDIIMKTFIFVKEFMVLPEKMERLLEQELEEFMGTTTLPQIKVSEGTKRFAERIYAAAHDGKLPSEVIKEERQRAEEERQRAEEERQRLEEAAIRIEEERRRLEEAVVRLYSQFAMPSEQIAVAMNLPPIAVEEILRRYGHQ